MNSFVPSHLEERFSAEGLEMFSPYLEWLALLSLFTFFLSLIIIPWFLRRLPSKFFLRMQRRPTRRKSRHVMFLALRNIAGILLVAAGFAMIFLPGQGILTILIGLLFMSFPGKRRLVLYILSRRSIRRSLNWTRNKMKRPPFEWQE